jgi:hypothetical protein
MHGESSKRWERQCRARLQRLDDFKFCQVACWTRSGAGAAARGWQSPPTGFREACLAQEQLKFGHRRQAAMGQLRLDGVGTRFVVGWHGDNGDLDKVELGQRANSVFSSKLDSRT